MSARSPGVVIVSPSRYSFYTLTVAHGLLKRGVKVEAIIFRKLLNPQRFTSELRRDGSRLIRKIFDKLILRQRAYQAEHFETLPDYMKREGVAPERVDHFARRNGIAVSYCADLNDPSVIATLAAIKPRLVVFTGGGLLRKPLLQAAGDGVLNCHSGVLPEYRGMDVVEWAVLEGRDDKVGVTVHFMDRGLDTGDILHVEPIPPLPGESLPQLRTRMEPIMCRVFVDTIVRAIKNELARKSQRIEDGRQYFVMHPLIMDYARRVKLGTASRA